MKGKKSSGEFKGIWGGVVGKLGKLYGVVAIFLFLPGPFLWVFRFPFWLAFSLVFGLVLLCGPFPSFGFVPASFAETFAL